MTVKKVGKGVLNCYLEKKGANQCMGWLCPCKRQREDLFCKSCRKGIDEEMTKSSVPDRTTIYKMIF